MNLGGCPGGTPPFYSNKTIQFSMKKIYSKKHSHIKKQFIAQKLIHLLGKNKYVLFLHHSGAASCNWQKFKERIQLDFPLHSLLLPSKISRYVCLKNLKCTDAAHPSAKGDSAFSKDQKEISIQGGALLVACSSLSQCSAVLEKCSPPDLLCIGGCFPGMPFSSYLDIQRWVELHKKSEQVYGSLLAQLVQWQRLFLTLENNLQRLALVPWASWLLKKRLVSLLESEKKAFHSPSSEKGVRSTCLSEQCGKTPKPAGGGAALRGKKVKR